MACSMQEETKNAYGVLIMQPEESRPLKRLSSRRENSTKTELKDVGWVVVWLWTGDTQGRDRLRPLVNTLISSRILY
jgi:hypothetical protein